MKFCEQCEILFDCQYNLEKHNEIIHLSRYDTIPLISPKLNSILPIGLAAMASVISKGLIS